MSTKKFLGACSAFLSLLVLEQQELHAAYSKNASNAISQNQTKQNRNNHRAGIRSPLCNRQHWNPSLQFLYWTTNYNWPFTISVLSEMPNTTTGSTKTEIFKSAFIDSKVDRSKQRWSPGVRLGMAYDSNWDRIDFQLFWTYYHNHTHKLVPNTTMSSSSTTVNSLVGYGFTKSSSSLNYNVADVELGRTFLPSCKVALRPFLSLRAFWLNQHNSALFADSQVTFVVGEQGSLLPPVPGVHVTVDEPVSIRLDFIDWGVGPRAGLNTNFGDFHGFSLFGNISAALLYGKNRTKLYFDITTASQPTVPIGAPTAPVDVDYTNFKAKDKYWQLFPNLQLFMGVSWGRCFNRGKNSIRFNAGWESNFLWETSNILFFDKSISFQGLTLDFNFGF